MRRIAVILSHAAPESAWVALFCDVAGLLQRAEAILLLPLLEMLLATTSASPGRRPTSTGTRPLVRLPEPTSLTSTI